MLALFHHHPLLTAITAGIVVSVVVGVLLKRVDDWFQGRAAIRRRLGQ